MDLDRHFSEEKIQMASEYVERGPRHSVITDVCSKATVRVLQKGPPGEEWGELETMAKIHWRQKLEPPG